MKANESITYNYTGKCQKITLEPGNYRIECFGGKGGGNTGAKGDKTTGYYSIKKRTNLFLYIGGQSTSGTGGWNGGQTVTESGVYGGGGATSVALNGTDGSTNWNDSKHLNSRLIMAAGGQGQGKTGGATTGTFTSTRIDARTEFVNRQGVHAGYIIPKKSGTVYFRSNGYNYDPYGFIDDANGKQLASNDDSGRTGSYFGSPPWNGEHHYWDWLIQMNVQAGVKYQFRVGSFASSLGANITGWAKWYATFPESEVVLYMSITSGGKGGGSNYFASSLFSTSTNTLNNAGNGKVVITRIGHQIVTTNCTADTTYVVGGETVTLNVSKTLWLDGYAQAFAAFQTSYPKINILKENEKYLFIVPVELDLELAYGEKITIEAIFTKMRCNSNYYKDSIPQSFFDFEKIVGDS